MDPSDPGVVAAAAVRAFQAAGVPYLVGGSVASTLHGEPRGTLDVDFAVHLQVEQADALHAALTDEFIVDLESVREAARDARMFNAIHSKLYVKADVHVRRNEGHSASEMARAIEIELPGGSEPIRTATPEDTALRKLWWYRAGGEVSERQWRDVLGVVRVLGEAADLDYMRHWAGPLGVEDLLERVLGER